MREPIYWLDLFTGKTWQEFLDAGGTVTGFRERRWKAVQRLQPGDILLCYLTGISRWVGLLEVTSEAYQDTTPIWHDALFPCRVHVRPRVCLTPETAVPISLLRDRLSIFSKHANNIAWTGHLRGSPAKWDSSDGRIVADAVREAQQNPVHRAVNLAKLARKPRVLTARRLGRVTIPDNMEAAPVDASSVSLLQPSTGTPDANSVSPLSPSTVQQSLERIDEPTLHTEVQGQLLELGTNMGLDVWVARNDRHRQYNGRPFVELSRLKTELPLQFDEATKRTIELIDVLWLQGNAIVAAFEIECTTSIYSGLLRMADLIAMQPNLNIPLYLVAPEERRLKVITEVNRPTFSRLSPPLKAICRFISIPTLQERVAQAAPLARFLRPEFLEDLAEICDLESLT